MKWSWIWQQFFGKNPLQEFSGTIDNNNAFLLSWPLKWPLIQSSETTVAQISRRKMDGSHRSYVRSSTPRVNWSKSSAQLRESKTLSGTGALVRFALIRLYSCSVTPFKYVEGGPEHKAPEVVWNTSSIRMFKCVFKYIGFRMFK